jgi:signal peptide peptidase SppA
MARNEQICKTILNRAWALHPGKLEELGLFIERRLAGDKLEVPAAAAKPGGKAKDAYEVRDGVAILPVYGILDKRMNMFMNFSGGTSTELLARDFHKALSDPRVQAILLDVDSPGGSVDGTKELADLILASREGGKPVVTYANGLMASAAYWIGAGAQFIVAPATAEIGSIGVALMHYDYSAADAMVGVKRTVITGGKYKRIASDEKPLSKEGQEYLQGMVDDYYALFVEGVAAARGFDPETVHERMADGRIFVGKKALKAGLVDKIGTFNDALAIARAKGGAMPKNMTKTQLAEGNPELYAQIKAEGAGEVTLETLLKDQPQAADKLRAEGRDAGVKEERARVVEILEDAGLAGISLKVIQDGSDPKAALKLFLKHQDQVKAEALAALGVQAPPVVGTDPPKVETHTETGDGAPIETRAKAKWDKDPKLRDQYLNRFETFLAFMRGEEQGSVKIIGKG